MIATVLPTDKQLSQILELLAQRLQLTPTQDDKARSAYESVTDWLAADGNRVAKFSPTLFPQGSLRLGTTVKPITRSEFDLDVVCLLNLTGNCDPQTVYDLVWERMREHGTYRNIMEPMPRCIRLNYAEDSQFHLDIVPAVPDPTKGGTFIRIPDKPKPKLVTWKTSNPKGFAAWFEIQTVLLGKYARAGIEPLPGAVPAEEKAVLSKAVQLLKRWRDVYFRERPEHAPSSIILTTLAAAHYAGEPVCSVALSHILEGLVMFAQSGRTEIRNPANDDEVISEKWVRDRDSYEAFVVGIAHFRDRWQELVAASDAATSGLGDVAQRLRELFGEPALEAVKAAAEEVGTARSNSQLYIAKSDRSLFAAPAVATVTESTVKARANNFYGN